MNSINVTVEDFSSSNDTHEIVESVSANILEFDSAHSDSTEHEIKDDPTMTSRDAPQIFGSSALIYSIASNSTNTSLENLLNSVRTQLLDKKHRNTLIRLIRESDLEFGYDSPVDTFIQSRLQENSSVTREWLNEIFVQYYGDQQVVVGILRTIAHLEYSEIAPQGITMATAALVHSSVEVRECGIRAFENWDSLESLKVLSQIRCEEEWLAEYIKQVISGIESTHQNVADC